jgi:hypothetical protein
MTPPGYSEAVEREQERRSRAWLGIGTVLFDAKGKPAIRLRPLTYRTYLSLAASGNAFATHVPNLTAAETVGHLCAAVWLLCDRHRAGWGVRAYFAARAVRKTVLRLPVESTVAAIEAHIHDAFADAPVPIARPTIRKAPKTSQVASVAMSLHRHAGLSISDVLDMPLGQVWQLVREIEIRADPTTNYDDESERVKRAFLLQQTELLQRRATSGG